MSQRDRGIEPEPPIEPPPRAIQAPWREAYFRASETEGGASEVGQGSFFRGYWLKPEGDARNHVVGRTQHGLILLNRYPYAGGHLMAALGEPRARLLDYSPGQRAELWRLTELAAELMDRALRPQGINIGINEGRAAGAGVPQHLHVHLVPRWHGDVNFMAAVGNVRVIPNSLEAMGARYREEWGKMANSK